MCTHDHKCLCTQFTATTPIASTTKTTQFLLPFVFLCDVWARPLRQDVFRELNINIHVRFRQLYALQLQFLHLLSMVASVTRLTGAALMWWLMLRVCIRGSWETTLGFVSQTVNPRATITPLPASLTDVESLANSHCVSVLGTIPVIT